MISVLSLNCTADAFINSAQSNRNFGCYNVLFVGRKNCYTIYRALIKASLASIPDDAVILSAKLRLYMDSPQCPSVTQQLTPFLVTQPWSESTVTWDNSPAFDGEISGSTVAVKGTGSYETDVTSIVQAWYGGVCNNGILLKSEEDQEREVKRFVGCKASKCGQIFLRPVFLVKVRTVKDSRDVVLVGREFTDISRTVLTADNFACTGGQNTSQYSTVTFFVKNNGFYPAAARIEISPNGIDYTPDDNFEFLIGAGELKALVPMKFGKFTRICYRSANPFQSTELVITMQAHV